MQAGGTGEVSTCETGDRRSSGSRDLTDWLGA